MRKTFISAYAAIIAVVLVFTSCNVADKKSSSDCKIKIKDIGLADKSDTISYALGVAWGYGLGHQVGLSKISNAFYIGVQDYISGDTALMGIYKANDYLEANKTDLKPDPSWPDNDNNISVCDIPMKSKFDTISYAIGFAWCRAAFGIGISKVTPSLILGLSKGIKGDTSLFSFRTADKYLWSYVEELRLEKFADVKKKNEEWLEVNKTQPGVVVLESGVQFKVLKSGDGNSPTMNDIVECHMVFRLIDGTIIENSYNTNETKKFYLFAVCRGLAEAILHMKEGDKWEIYIPYNMAYGSGGIKDQVPPFGTVIFEVDLIRVAKNN